MRIVTLLDRDSKLVATCETNHLFDEIICEHRRFVRDVGLVYREVDFEGGKCVGGSHKTQTETSPVSSQDPKEHL